MEMYDQLFKGIMSDLFPALQMRDYEEGFRALDNLIDEGDIVAPTQQDDP